MVTSLNIIHHAVFYLKHEVSGRAMDNVQNCDSYVKIPSSQSYRSSITVYTVRASEEGMEREGVLDAPVKIFISQRGAVFSLFNILYVHAY
jgi:uncharacterized protein YxeA